MPKEKTVLVTGGARGIGSAIASAFASEGSTVWVTDRNIDNAELRDGNTAGVRLETLDVSDQAAIQRFVDTLDSLDILVNCAGIILRENQEHEVEGFQRVIDINLVGTMRMCTACKPLLAESSGCVLNVASMLSLFGSGFVPAYSASKGGIVQLTKSLAIAWARDGIRVNAIAPGWIETAMTHSLSTDPERHRAIVDRTPMRRWGKPKDLAGAALFLCSSQAAFIRAHLRMRSVVGDHGGATVPGALIFPRGTDRANMEHWNRRTGWRIRVSTAPLGFRSSLRG